MTEQVSEKKRKSYSDQLRSLDPERITPQHQLAVTTHTIVERLSGETEDFDTLEKTSHLKSGLEVPLMGVASIPDTLEKIYRHRLEKSVIKSDGGVDIVTMGNYKQLRYEHAIEMLRDMDKHYLQLSVAVEGKRSQQLVDIGGKIQTHNAETSQNTGFFEGMRKRLPFHKSSS